MTPQSPHRHIYEYTYTGSNNRALTFSLHLHHFKHLSLFSAQWEQTPVGQLQVYKNNAVSSRSS